jgi:hypothetical protein
MYTYGDRQRACIVRRPHKESLKPPIAYIFVMPGLDAYKHAACSSNRLNFQSFGHPAAGYGPLFSNPARLGADFVQAVCLDLTPQYPRAPRLSNPLKSINPCGHGLWLP